ncbi:NRAMP family divalent metal transporter [Athalassotoga saccharophila]|uniref:NRAMP family divalent metal transporter n=1 Tax=Athalassotoga saccharophila TaxID=1441386 RepID=UPI0018D9C996|nr:NRAMP family divalent metal transporter [Athalassotoga saccharophila]BBJ29027.1 divalent metal cation transporter MntH [Athalassotoga saccharophila]
MQSKSIKDRDHLISNHRRRHRHHFIHFFGPAWLTMMADMDAASTISAAEVGATFKYGLIWFMLLLTVPLFFVQEAAGRIGVVTQQGLGTVIRKRYSKRTALALTIPMVITDVITYIAEYAGIAIGLKIFGISPFVSLPVVFVLHILLITKRKYAQFEKLLLAISGVLIATFVITLIFRGIRPYSPVYFIPSTSFFYMLAVTVGAVVMPFMLFFQASAAGEKVSIARDHFGEEGETYLKRKALSLSKKETLIGAIVTEFLMVVVEMVATGIDPSDNLMSPKELSTILSSIAGPFSPYIFGIGLAAAGFLALVVVSLGSAWGFVEAANIPKDKAWIVYVLESLPAVFVPMIFSSDLINFMLDLMVIFVFVLIGPGIMVGIISSDKKIMGEYASNKKWKIFYWSSFLFVLIFGFIALSSL